MFTSKGEYLYHVGFENIPKYEFPLKIRGGYQPWKRTAALASKQHYSSSKSTGLEKCINQINNDDLASRGSNMVLLKSSENCSKFLFYHLVEESLGVYSLEYKTDAIHTNLTNFLA